MFNCQLEPDHQIPERIFHVENRHRCWRDADVITPLYRSSESSSPIGNESFGKGKGPHRDRVFIYKLGQLGIPQINNI